MQTKKAHSFKQWRLRSSTSCLALFLGMPLLTLLIYFGYCWGLWGRQSLLLQHFFQCNCPPSSEEARYSKQVEVLVSACSHVNSHLLPGGTFLYVEEEKLGATSTYLLNLQTLERIEYTYQPFSSFLPDDLIFIEKGIEDVIIDRITGTEYPIKDFRFWQENSYVNGEPNLDLLLAAVSEAEQVFFIQQSNTVIALSQNFRGNLEGNFTFSRSDIPGWGPDQVEQFLQENNVSYHMIPLDFPREAVSADGKLIARDEGIYLVETNQIVVKVTRSFVRGWTSDGQGVIYSSPPRCLVRRFVPMADDIGCAVHVPQAVLLLKVPNEYLIPK